jgi:alcohol dehydrogenase
MLATGQLDVSKFLTHRFALDEMETGYETFSQPQETGALKVALIRG